MTYNNIMWVLIQNANSGICLEVREPTTNEVLIANALSKGTQIYEGEDENQNYYYIYNYEGLNYKRIEWIHSIEEYTGNILIN